MCEQVWLFFFTQTLSLVPHVFCGTIVTTSTLQSSEADLPLVFVIAVQ